MSLTLEQLNTRRDSQAREFFLSCCSCQTWAASMSRARPFSSLENMLTQASRLWRNCGEEDILEAFNGHAKIGDLDAIAKKFTARDEQGQVRSAPRAILEDIKRLNDEYEDTFGFIFIVFATGKSAEQMLGLLADRMLNSREQELANGAAEQERITALRLTKSLVTAHS